MSIARSSLLMASGTIISRVMGFARAVLTAMAIGVTTNAADAFGVANQLPNNVYAIIAGGTLNAVLVPQLVRARKHDDDGRGYINRLLTFIIMVFLAVTLVATIAAPLLIRLYTNGWSEAQLALATAFAYWCLPQLFFYGLYSLLGEVLNSRSKFGPFMWAPVLNNVVQLAGLAGYIWLFGLDPIQAGGLGAWTSDRIAWLAGSATLGVAAQAVILFAAWRQIGLKLRPNFKWRGFGLRPALKTASWSLGMVLVTQLGGLVQTIVASGVVNDRNGSDTSIASVAAFNIAWLLFMLPHSVVTVSIATAYFTKMSHHAQAGEFAELKGDLVAGLKSISFVAILATAVLIVLAYPAARVFVGEFPATAALGNVIVALLIGLLPFSFVYMIQRAFYSLEDTRTPFWFTVVQIGIHMTGSITMSFLVPARWLVFALALLTSVSVLVQALLAGWLLARRIGPWGRGELGKSIARYAAGAAAAAIVGWLILELLGGGRPGAYPLASVLNAVVTMFAVGSSMLVTYAISMRLLAPAEFAVAWRAVTKSLGGIVRK
ncbi:MAG: murein biosynthesis integral membrane protein MurJ [Actinomycetales bacterium]|nr:murein biosynthesis integral membrane protein MurJ [Actinomycetales bacterium]